MPQSPHNLALPLLRWYDTVHANRDMPWRQTRDPYAIWVSEIMLQQTQVETVKPYYVRFMARFPTVQALAAAPLQEVLALWAGLGYYRRAKHLHAAAGEIVARFGGSLPGDVENLRTLPGIGRYTAGAIASIAFGQPAPAVDGNVMRVLARLTAYGNDIAQARHQEHFWNVAGAIHAGRASRGRTQRSGDINQALMELGATVCTPANPRCGDCPLRRTCQAHAAGRQADYPVKAAKKAVPVMRLAVWIIRCRTRAGPRVLMMQRPAGGLWEGMWEFPAAPAARGQLNAVSLASGVIPRLPPRRLGTVKHQLTHRTLLYQVYAADAAGTAAPARDAVAPYVNAKWLLWPLARQHSLPLAAVVHKIAALADSD